MLTVSINMSVSRCSHLLQIRRTVGYRSSKVLSDLGLFCLSTNFLQMLKISRLHGCHIFATEDAYFESPAFPSSYVRGECFSAGIFEIFESLKDDFVCSDPLSDDFFVPFVSD